MPEIETQTNDDNLIEIVTNKPKKEFKILTDDIIKKLKKTPKATYFRELKKYNKAIIIAEKLKIKEEKLKQRKQKKLEYDRHYHNMRYKYDRTYKAIKKRNYQLKAKETKEENKKIYEEENKIAIPTKTVVIFYDDFNIII